MENPVILIGLVVLAIVPYLLLLRIHALLAEIVKITGHAMLSRAVAGMRGGALIVNLPGNPKAVRENLDLLLSVLPHALDLLTGRPESGQEHREV